MNITDLTGAYQECYLDRNDQVAYHASHPELFSHYHTFWGKLDREPVRMDKPELTLRRQIIMDSLPELERRLSRVGIDLTEVELVLMVGQNTSNGHGLIAAGRSLCWLAVETYTTPLLAKVFITHELVHACHYLHNNDFYFTDKNQQEDPMRQLLTEGIATYLSKTALKIDSATALWADYLDSSKQRAWMRRCREDISGLAQYFLTAISTNYCGSMFVASDPKNIYKYRSGYFLGLAIIEAIVSREGLKPQQLLTVPRYLLEKHANSLLQKSSDLL